MLGVYKRKVSPSVPSSLLQLLFLTYNSVLLSRQLSISLLSSLLTASSVRSFSLLLQHIFSRSSHPLLLYRNKLTTSTLRFEPLLSTLTLALVPNIELQVLIVNSRECSTLALLRAVNHSIDSSNSVEYPEYLLSFEIPIHITSNSLKLRNRTHSILFFFIRHTNTHCDSS